MSFIQSISSHATHGAWETVTSILKLQFNFTAGIFDAGILPGSKIIKIILITLVNGFIHVCVLC